MKKQKIIKKADEIRSVSWVRVAVIIGIPFLTTIIINPEWLGRTIAYISLFVIIVIILIRELVRTDYGHVKIFDPKTKKIFLMFTRALGLIGLLFLIYGSINYSKDVIFLIKNRKPVEASGVVTEYRATAYTGFGLLGQFLDIKMAGQSESQDFTLVLHSIVKKDSHIRFYYLPNSNLIVQVLDD